VHKLENSQTVSKIEKILRFDSISFEVKIKMIFPASEKTLGSGENFDDFVETS
jgi:hypothetical protein